jgi:hypothetical protein
MDAERLSMSGMYQLIVRDVEGLGVALVQRQHVGLVARHGVHMSASIRDSAASLFSEAATLRPSGNRDPLRRRRLVRVPQAGRRPAQREVGLKYGSPPKSQVLYRQ